jgi:hypothetical protein
MLPVIWMKFRLPKLEQPLPPDGIIATDPVARVDENQGSLIKLQIRGMMKWTYN